MVATAFIPFDATEDEIHELSVIRDCRGQVRPQAGHSSGWFCLV